MAEICKSRLSVNLKCWVKCGLLRALDFRMSIWVHSTFLLLMRSRGNDSLQYKQEHKNIHYTPALGIKAFAPEFCHRGCAQG